MKRFSRLFSLVFLTLILCANVSYAQDKTEPSNEPPATTSIENSDAPTTAEPDEDEGGANDEYGSADFRAKDLAVQERMADASEEANKLINRQNLIGYGGLFLVFLTFLTAVGAWLAGRDAVNVARNIGQKQVKAYLSFESGRIGTMLNFVAVEVIVKNYGQSPCLKGNASGFLRMNKIGEPDAESLMTKRKKVALGVIPAGGEGMFTFSWNVNEIGVEWFGEVSNDEIFKLIHVEIEWDDVFGTTDSIFAPMLVSDTPLDLLGDPERVKWQRKLQVIQTHQNEKFNHREPPE